MHNIRLLLFLIKGSCCILYATDGIQKIANTSLIFEKNTICGFVLSCLYCAKYYSNYFALERIKYESNRYCAKN